MQLKVEAARLVPLEHLCSDLVENSHKEEEDALCEIEERRKAWTEVEKRIKEANSSCDKVVNQVSQTWEALTDGSVLEKVEKELCTTEIEATQWKSEMKKLPLA